MARQKVVRTTVYDAEVVGACVINTATETREEANIRLKFLNKAYRWALQIGENTDLIREASKNIRVAHDLEKGYRKTVGVGDADKAILSY